MPEKTEREDYARLYVSIERLALDWQNEADRADREGLVTHLDLRAAVAALRNRLSDVPAPPGREMA